MAFKFELGQKVKEKVTGYEGIIVTRSEHLYGCMVYAVKSEKLHDGKPIDSQWFDEGSLEVIGKGKTDHVKQGGGPAIPQRRPDGVR
jgi:hypothetical protein